MAEKGLLDELFEPSVASVQPQQHPTLQVDPLATLFGGAAPARGIKPEVGRIAPKAKVPEGDPEGVIGHSASGADFEKFSSEFIGTGMGHAYSGRGFYFSENPSYSRAMKEQYFPKGKAYKTKINAHPEEFFDLSAPASPELVQSVAREVGAQTRPELPTHLQQRQLTLGLIKNRDVLNALEQVGTNTYRRLLNDPMISTSQEGASRYLAQSGFKGNSFTDAYGKHYVVFDPEHIQILEKQ